MLRMNYLVIDLIFLKQNDLSKTIQFKTKFKEK